MAKSLVILLLCLSSVYSDMEMKVEMPKEELSEKMDDTSASVKSKRYLGPSHPTPCPPNWPHYNKGWQEPTHNKVQFLSQPHYAHKPAVTVIKPNSGWNNPWQQNLGYSKASYGLPMSLGWNPGWQSPNYNSNYKSSVWPSSNLQSYGYQSSLHKPAYSYAPSYQKSSYHVPNINNWVKPVHQADCPPYQHNHAHTGIVYAPQHQYNHQPQHQYHHQPQHQYHHQPQHQYHHQPQYQYHHKPQYQYHHQPQYQYHHQPQIVKVAKPLYHHPQPLYHQPQPLYHHTPSFHHPVHHLPHDEPCD